MKVFMLLDNGCGKYYRRSRDSRSQWVDQSKASIWTSRQGPVAALSRMSSRMETRCRIVVYTLTNEEFV